LNEKLSGSLKQSNLKITEIKMKYKAKASSKCAYCHNEVEMAKLGGSFYTPADTSILGGIDDGVSLNSDSI
jgi:hypothetical protein